jgi:hypothetical protein
MLVQLQLLLVHWWISFSSARISSRPKIRLRHLYDLPKPTSVWCHLFTSSWLNSGRRINARDRPAPSCF